MKQGLKIMEKERLGAFIDAVLAIVMTILVLDLERPESYTFQGLWEMRTNFFAYALSFFWLGAMWVNLHFSYHLIKKISQKTVWATIVMLFFSSFFPYATKLIATHFDNEAMQVFYGIVVLLITFSVIWYYRTLEEANPESQAETLRRRRSSWMKWDIAIKILGLVLSLTVYHASVSLAILFTLCFLVIPNQFR